MSEIIVLGAGIVGVATAIALQDQGHDVQLIDRRGPGEETSFGNAGVIQSEARAPYAMPRAPLTLLRMALGLGNDVLLDPLRLPAQTRALVAYFHHSAPHRHAKIAAAYAPLIARTTRDHLDLAKRAGADALIRKSGLGEIYDTQKSLDAAAAFAASAARDHDLRHDILSGSQMQATEPCIKTPPKGAIIWHDSWSTTDPGALVRAHGRLAADLGVDFQTGAIEAMRPTKGGWTVSAANQSWTARHLVLALGPWTPKALQPLGYKIGMIRKRGYHGQYKAEAKLTRPYLLADHGVVLSSMSDGLRITTGAHLTSLDAPQNLRQLRHGQTAARTLIGLETETTNSDWSGTRPCLPDMLPLVGSLPRHENLWVNFGHGHQGFTLGPTTGKLLADAIAGQSEPIATPLDPRTRRGV